MSEKIAAVLVNYESGEDLLSALRSLLSLERYPDMLIVVDNASTDDSLLKAEQEYPGLRVIRNIENRGFAKAANQGISTACRYGATHVWLFNPDARARAESLSSLIVYSRQYPKGLLSPIIFDRHGESWFSGGDIDFFRMRAVHKTILGTSQQDEQGFLTGCSLFIPRCLIDEIGFFDERFFLYYEDADYSVRAREAGYKLLVVPGSKVDHAEVSEENPKKIYFLVYSGLLFFFKHASGWRKSYLHMYVTIRRLKNWADCLLFGGKEAISVRQAYGDFFQKTHESEVFTHHG